MDSRRRRIPAIAGGAASGTEGRRLSPVDIQSKEFRLAFRGYNEREVDQFLDEVTEEMARLHAESKRLREELELKGTVRLDSATLNEADEILRRAREQAARIVAEAEAESARPRAEGQAAAPAGPAAGVTSASFLARERDFLQRLAGAIQDHAHAVRAEIRRTRVAENAVAAGPGPAGAQTPAVRSGGPEGPPQNAGTADPSDAGPPTQTWTPPFASAPGEGEPRSPERSEPGEARTAPGDKSDTEPVAGSVSGAVTGLASREPAIVIAPIEAPPNQEPAGSPQEDRLGGDRSLRELFWGED